MGDRFIAAEAAAGCLSDAIYDVDKYDADSLRDSVFDDHIASAVESACVYYHACAEIISRYEHDYGRDAEDLADGAGPIYKASQWQEAQVAYAAAICDAAIRAEAETLLSEVAERADSLAALANENGASGIDASDLRVTLNCPHGRAPHERETADGAHIWQPGELEGCRAVAIDAGPFWLSYTWTPEAPADDASADAPESGR
ncbi:MAG: hypothetical protein IPK81_14065 [Rhodospirillales bacterium]|nr:MAG: hypothetical protein IPK81_14065 [Rhodospirillales bacterium]